MLSQASNDETVAKYVYLSLRALLVITNTPIINKMPIGSNAITCYAILLPANSLYLGPIRNIAY